MDDIRQFCTFYLGELRLAVDVHDVQEVVTHQVMTRVPLAPPTVRGLLNLRGQIITGIDLRRRLDLPPLEATRQPMNVVLRGQDSPVSLLVDSIGEVVQVPGGECESCPVTVGERMRELILGVYRLEDGLLLVLDIDRTLDLDPTGAGTQRRTIT